uniref:Uncharacterized protein LOC105053328 n=1 Tax=Elaeis guineensis var. tenera TaxID=51953 RepID=A0A6I9RUB9_ELAGV|nr:uncharacterized protein LOC105053328 [Elaeis guineensis]
MGAVTRHPICFPASPALNPIRHHPRVVFSSSSSSPWFELAGNRRILLSSGRRAVRFRPLQAAISARREDVFDPELRPVLELATDDELYELQNILFGPRNLLYYSLSGTHFGIAKAFHDIFAMLDNQLLYQLLRFKIIPFKTSHEKILTFSGTDSLSLLSLFNVGIRFFFFFLFFFVIFGFVSEISNEMGPVSFPWDDTKISNGHGSLEVGLSQWKVHTFSALRFGAKQLQQIFLKGGGMLTVTKIYEMVAQNLSGKMLLEAANYEIKHEIIKRGGQLAAVSLESRAAALAARQGLCRAATQYLGLRSLMMLLGPLMWGTFLADIVIQMLGTDYARILRAIYAFAQIRLT